MVAAMGLPRLNVRAPAVLAVLPLVAGPDQGGGALLPVCHQPGLQVSRKHIRLTNTIVSFIPHG